MKITVGSTSIDATYCERLRDSKIGFHLYIKVPKGALTADEIYALFDGTTETIAVTRDDGTEESYTGFNAVHNFGIGATEYMFAQACRSELEAQFSLARSQIAALVKKNTEYEKIINNQTQTLGQCIEAINAQELIISKQKSAIEALNEQLAIQDEVSIDLYNSQMEQEEVNAVQDEALIEIYSKIGGN